MWRQFRQLWKWTQKLLLKGFYLARKCSFPIDCRPGSSELWHEVAIGGISKIILRWRKRTLTTVWKQTESVPWCRRHITHQKENRPTNLLFSLFSSSFCPFVLCCFTSAVFYTEEEPPSLGSNCESVNRLRNHAEQITIKVLWNLCLWTC